MCFAFFFCVLHLVHFRFRVFFCITLSRTLVSETPTSWLVVVCFQAKYEATAKLTSPQSKAEMLSAVRTMVFGVRSAKHLASERLARAVEKGEGAHHQDYKIITALELLAVRS